MTDTSDFHPSAARAFGALDREAPDAPFAAFGQTVFWDEPMKRVLLEARDALGEKREALVGVHDLDYFSRMPEGHGDDYVALAHNDTDTRDMWAAAGELSSLFGCEAFVTREWLNEVGVRLNVALGPHLDGLDKATECAGWRGLVRRSGDAPVVRDLPARDVLEPLCELLAWGFDESARRLSGRRAKERARAWGEAVVARLREEAAAPDVESLSDLLARMVPHVWGALNDAPPPAMTPSRTSDVFRFNTRTYRLPRFRLLECFLNPQTAPGARRAYDAAVEGAPIYRLDAFGTGALPFDLYVPGRGRGTLFALDDHFVAHTTPRTILECDGKRVKAECLARMVEEQLGDGCALVGKAVTMVAMLSAEFAFVLNETGSAYMPRVHAFVRGLRAAGLPYPTHPVVRLRYPTWDALAATETRFHLPPHLARAFDAVEITGPEFAARWREVVKEQEALIRRLGKRCGAVDILGFLGCDRQEEWLARLEVRQTAQAQLLDVQREVGHVKRQVAGLRARDEEALEELEAAQRRRGEFNRRRYRPRVQRLAAETDREDRAELQRELDALEVERRERILEVERLEAERRELDVRRKELTRVFRDIEQSPRAAKARRDLAKVERMAEKERLCIARNASLAVEGLRHGDVRPAAWWLPLADPSGAWYAETRRRTEFRIERLGQ